MRASVPIDIAARTDEQNVNPARCVITLKDHSPTAHAKTKTGAVRQVNHINITAAGILGQLG